MASAPEASRPLTPDRTAAAGIPSWDPAAIVRATRTAGSSEIAGLAWTNVQALQAIAVVAPLRESGAGWFGERMEMGAADERGRPLGGVPPSSAPGANLLWDRPLVHPGATGFRVIEDTAGHVPAPPFATSLERVAHAWNMRSPGLLATPTPAMRPRIAFRRDVRERVQALAPFLTLGSAISALVRADTLYWAVELYSTAETYPLSERLIFAGEARAYVHHAATAFVNAGTGRVLIAAEPAPDAIMRTWMRRFPWLFVRMADAPAELIAQRPPAVDWAAIQATALARTGIGDSPDAARAVIGVDNADADLVDAPPTFFATPGSAALQWSVPLVDAAGAVRGVLVARGAADTRTVWVGTARSDKWSDILDRLQRSADSAGIGRQRRNARRGRVLAVPAGNGLIYSQAHYEWPAEGSPVLTGVAAYTDGTSHVGNTVAEALGAPRSDLSRADAAFRAGVTALHRRMEDAMRRGDWTAFGTAFEALGRLLRPPGR